MNTERLRGDRTTADDLEPWSAIFLADDFAGEQLPCGLRTPAHALEVHDRDRAHWARFGFGPWSVRERASGAYVGRIGLDYTRATGRPEVQIGWIVAVEQRGNGYAGEMGAESVRVAFEILELDGVISLITADNHVCLAVAKTLGFRESGEEDCHGVPHLLLRLNRRD